MPAMPRPTVTRLGSDPVVRAGTVPGYGPIFNAGVLRHEGRFFLFARGVRDGYRRNRGAGPRFVNYRSDVLLFSSADGRSYAYAGVLARGSAEGVWSYEDPRVQWVKNGEESRLLMTYTDLPDPSSGQPWRIGVHRLVFREGTFHLNRTSGRVVGPPGVPDKDAVIFNLDDGRVALLHRVHPNIQLAIFDSIEALLSPPPGYWADHLARLEEHIIIRPGPGSLAVGAGAPPVRTDAGLLFFFHERTAAGTYTARAALLDPVGGGLLALLPDPILVPELDWELEGDVDDVVFLQGAERLEDGRIYLSYGAADHAVGVGSIDEGALLASMCA
jgi:predicted GH43/DUF377 family glycosyl hydrolase